MIYIINNVGAESLLEKRDSILQATYVPLLSLCTSLDNDKLDAHLFYFTMRPLQSSTCFENYMLIIRRRNCIDAASGIVLSVSGRPVYRTATDWEDRGRVGVYYVDILREPYSKWIFLNNVD